MPLTPEQIEEINQALEGLTDEQKQEVLRMTYATGYNAKTDEGKCAVACIKAKRAKIDAILARREQVDEMAKLIGLSGIDHFERRASKEEEIQALEARLADLKSRQ